MKNKFGFITILAVSLIVSSCGEGNITPTVRPDSKGSAEEYSVSTYNNNDFNDHIQDGNSTNENQWENYGISSPYIMRFNGWYYLYSSTTTNEAVSGVRAWKSRDLVHWNKVMTDGLKPGYVVSHVTGETLSARAPEVYYYANNFYMFESFNTGKGHFILRSNSPEGPFIPLNNTALDSLYDGTLCFDRDENPYFITAHQNNINISTMESIVSIIETEIPVKGTDEYQTLFAESPTVFEHMGKYYLLYSSSYSSTDGYQINYAVSDGWEDLTPGGLASSFHKGASTRLLLNADSSNGFTGLGHPSAVLGPDLDSYYLAYDCLNSYNEQHYGFNLDRLIISGDLLSTSHNRFESIAPKKAEFETFNEEGLVKDESFLLSSETSSDTFSVEYNFKNAQDSRLVFAYQDKNNYAYIGVNMQSSISLHKVTNGQDELLKDIEFYHFFSNDELHTIRLAYRDNKLDLHFENSLKLSAFDVSLSGGKVGYLTDDKLEINYTSFSNVARGLSDELEVKQATMDIPASAFAPAGQFKNAKSYLFNDGSGVFLREGNEYNHANELVLNNTYDYARYLSNFHSSGRYTLELTLDKSNLGKTIIVELDDGKDYELKIPTYVDINNEVIKVKVGDFFINKGIHQIKLQNGSDTLSLLSYRFVELGDKNYSLFASLKNEKNVRGLDFGSDSKWEFIDDKMISHENYRNIALTSEKRISDFNFSIDLTLTGSGSIFTESKQAGIIFRCNNYVSYKDYLDSHSDLKMWNNRFFELQGYYIAFTPRKIEFYRFDGDFNHYEIIDSIDYDFGNKTKRNIILKAKDNTFDLFIDGTYLKSYRDSQPFTAGSIGLYTTGAQISYQNFKLQTIF